MAGRRWTAVIVETHDGSNPDNDTLFTEEALDKIAELRNALRGIADVSLLDSYGGLLLGGSG